MLLEPAAPAGVPGKGSGDVERETVFDLIADREGERLDLFLARSIPNLSRSYAQKLVSRGAVTVGGKPEKASYHLQPGELVRAAVPPSTPAELAPEEMPLSIVYEDGQLIVVDKPAGIIVHPAPGHPSGTLVNAIIAHCPELSSPEAGLAGINGSLRPGIVHRLDKDTSGLLMVAKSDLSQQELSRQLKEREVHKVYLALVEGRLEPAEASIEAPVGRHPLRRKKMAVVEGGRPALTRYRVLRYYPAADGPAHAEPAEGRRLQTYTLIEAAPVTGRTHQIRVHLAALGHPVVGDPIYGHPTPLLNRHFLHAYRLTFRHPATGERLELEAPLPEDLAQALQRLAGSPPGSDKGLRGAP